MKSSQLLMVALRAVAVLILCRCSAATITWDGGGDGVTWHDAANWSGNVLPGPTDDAVLSGGPEVRVDGPEVSVRAVDLRRPMRVVNGGVTTVSGLSANGGSLILEGGVLAGPVVISNGVLLVSDATASAGPIELRGSSTLVGNIPQGLAVDVLGTSSAGSARTVWESGGTNRGTIRMRSINAGWSATLAMNGIPLVNAGTGVFSVEEGPGGFRRFEGGILNEGRIEIPSPLALTMAMLGGAFLEHRAGVVQLAEGSRVEVEGGWVRWLGGSLTGTGRLVAVDSRVGVAGTVTEAGTVWAARNAVFEGNGSTSATVALLGSSGFGHSLMTLDAAAVNRGTLRFLSESAGWTSRFDGGSQTLSNAVTGRIEFRRGAGGVRSFLGALANAGRLEGEADSGFTFRGRYEGWGGFTAGEVEFEDTVVRLQQSPSQADQLVLDGGGNSLETDVPPGYTLWVRGGGASHAFLRSSRSFRNQGTLKLESVGAAWTTSLELSGSPGLELTNDGLIEFGLGSGGQRILSGNLHNRAVLRVGNSVEWRLRNPDGLRFRQTSGEVAIGTGGAMMVEGGLFQVSGGVLGQGILLSNGTIDVDGTQVSGTLSAVGTEGVLIRQLSPLLTVRVHGGGTGNGHAWLRAQSGAVNAGTLLLESSFASWSSELYTSPGQVLVNASTGRIRSGLGSGGRRVATLTLRNAGLLEGVDGHGLDFVGTYLSEGGKVEPEVQFISATLDLTQAPASGSDFTVIGDSSRLVSDVPAGTAVRVSAGRSGGHTTVELPTEFSNSGEMDFTAAGAGWTVRVRQPGLGRVRNEVGATLRVLQGSSGARIFEGAVENFGAVEIQNPVEWVRGFRNAAGGTVQIGTFQQSVGSGTLFANAGTLVATNVPGDLRIVGRFAQESTGALQLAVFGTWNGVLVADEVASLAGRLELVLASGGTLPAENGLLSVVRAGTRLGTFANLALPALPAGLAWNPEYGPGSFGLRAVARDVALVPPVITLQPGHLALVSGATAQLRVEATGSAPLSYQWLVNGQVIAGQTGSVLDLGTVDGGDEGGYVVEVANAAGRTVSDVANVRIAEGFVPLSSAARTSLPTIGGDGVRIEVFNGIGGGPAPRNADLEGLAANAQLISPIIDFPRPGASISVGQSFETFFADTVVPPESVRALAAGNFILRHTFFLRVGPEQDLNPETTTIEMRLGVGSDDGFLLEIGGVLLGSVGDRGFTVSWMDVVFEGAGLYPVNLLFAANSVGASGLEWLRERPDGLAQIVPQEELYTSPNLGDRQITFEELAPGTVVSNQFRNLGVAFTTTPGIRVTQERPTRFVPVSASSVLGDPTESGAAPGVVELRFVVPGTDAGAVTDFVSLYVIDAETEGAVVEALDADGAVLESRELRGGGGAQERVVFSRAGIARVRASLGRNADTAAIDQIQFTLPVEFNRAPVITDPVAVAVNEGSPVDVVVLARDPDFGQTVTFALVEWPRGAAIHPTSGRFTWTPLEADGPGVFDVRIRATDNGLNPLADESVLRIEVREVNQLPTLLSRSDRFVEAGRTYSEALVASDPDVPVQTLRFILLNGPAGATLSESGLFTWAVPPTLAGTVPVTVLVEDGAGGSDEATFQLRLPVPLPNLLLTQLDGPPAADTGAPFLVSVREANLGTLPATGSWRMRIWLSTDALLDGGDTLLGEYPFNGEMLPTQFIGRTLQFRAPGVAGEYYVIAESDVENSIVEGSETDNRRVSRPMVVSSAYQAVVSTEFTTGLVGTPIPMVGTATRRNGAAAAFELVNVHIQVRGTRRVVSALTDANGRFELTFRPLPGEAGDYTIGASHPGEPSAPVQDTFRLLGLRAEPDQLAFDLPALTTSSNRFELVNLSAGPLTGLTVETESVPDGVAVSAVVPSGLAGDARVGVWVVVTSTADVDVDGEARLRVRSSEGPQASVLLPVRVRSARPQLVFDPAVLSVGALRGDQTIFPVTVRNTGGRPSGPLQLALPEVDWFTAAEEQPMPSLDPGESREIHLVLRPPAELPLTEQSGTVGLSDGSASATLRFSIAILSDAVGSLNVETVDEYTYYADGAPRVAGARVRAVRQDGSGTTVEGISDANGRTTFPGLREGWYEVTATADGHQTGRSVLLVRGGPATEVSVFLPRIAVQYFFTVDEISIEDRTRVTIETVFETAVPMPVVTVEPTMIDLEEIAQDRTEFEFKITNHGLIAAKAMRLAFSNSEGWRFTALQTDLGDLPARSSVTVPVVLERLSGARNAGPAAGGGCPGARVLWELVCGNQTNTYSGGVGVQGGNCGGGGIWAGGGGGGGTIGGSVVSASLGSCDPCADEMAGALLECAIGFIPLGDIPGCLKDTYDCLSDPDILGCLAALVSCLEAAGKEIPFVGDLLSVLDCLKTLKDAADECAAGGAGGGGGGGGGGGRGGGNLGGNRTGLRGQAGLANTISPIIPGLEGVNEQRLRLEAIIEPLVVLVGNRQLLMPVAGATGETFLQVFIRAASPAGDGGTTMTGPEIIALYHAPRPSSVSPEAVGAAIERWNRTMAYHARGIQFRTQVPAGESTDFIDRELLTRVLGAAAVGITANEAAGFREPMNAVLSAIDRMKAGFQGGGGAICARVRLRLEQDVVQARQGFQASLELVNNSDAALEGVKVELTMTDENGVPTTSQFGRLAPVLSDIGAVDGTGRVNVGTTGKASWVLIPGPEAAPTESPVRHFVAGTIEYQQGGLTVRQPIAPVAITVLPIPQLVLQYFHERDVRSDDPFTELVEPSIPYSLAVLVNNRGTGTARSLAITSSEPKIIENEKGLLIDFDLIATEVAGENLVPSMTASFGDLPSGETRVGRWLFQSTLQGQFIEYSATFEHTGPFSGLPELASVRDVSIHEMIHLVQADRGFNDGKPDFLVNDVPDDDFLPETLYLSDGSTNRVSVVREGTVDGPATTADREVRLTVTVPDGWTYLRLPDPSGGDLPLARVLRPDGSEVPFGWNVWTTDRTFIAGGRRPIYEDMLHLLDHTAAGTVVYTLVYAEPIPPDTTAPVSQVAALPPESRAQFQVQWSGSDNGSGVRAYDVLVSTDGGPFVVWRQATPDSAGIFTGEMGRNYAFQSVAIDVAGNRETPPAAADATTRVSRVNQPPVFGGALNVEVAEGSVLEVQVRAIDADVPADGVAHRLGTGAPAGMRIDPTSGRIVWPTGEGSGPLQFTVEVIASDDGLPSQGATNRVTVSVIEDNDAPILSPVPDQVVAESQLLELVLPAVDVDLPAQTLTFRWVGAVPAGASINPVTGLFRWRPNPTQGPSTNDLVYAVSDGIEEAQRTLRVVVRDTEADFKLRIGEALVHVGETGAVDLTLESELELSTVTAQITLGAEGLTQWTIADLSTQVGQASLEPVGPRAYALSIQAGIGQSLRMQGLVGRLRFGTDPLASSAFVRVVPESLTGGLGTETLSRARGTAGRVILLGTEPLVEAMVDRTGRLYGLPGVRYRLETSPVLDGTGWLPWREELLQGSIGILPEVPAGDRFVRAIRLP